MLHQKHESYQYVLILKNWVDWITARQDTVSQPQKCTFWDLTMTTFYNFALKTEASWAREVVKLILETWNANDVIVHVWFIYSRIR